MYMGTTDWRDDKSLSGCLSHMLESENRCDVTFIVGEDKIRISAHKTVLASRSDVFDTMFNGFLPEKGDVVVPDINEKTFREILRFIYCDEISISEENVRELLYASDKYMLAALKKACEKELHRISSTEHAAIAFEAAQKYHLNDLLSSSFKHIEMNTESCLLSKYALDLSKDCVDVILQNDFLKCTETDVCKFFFKWIESQCKVKGLEPNSKNFREISGDSLFSIRFPIVDMKYFTDEIASIGLMSHAEMVDIYMSHFGSKISTSSKFKKVPRTPVKERQTFHIPKGDTWAYSSTYRGDHALTFHSNANIWLKQLTVFTPECCQPSKSSSFTFKVKITDDDDNEVFSTSENWSTNELQRTLDFYEPFLIEAEKDYTAIITFPYIHFPNGFTLTQLINCKSVYEEQTTGVKLTFKSSPKSTTETNEKQGVFRTFGFSV